MRERAFAEACATQGIVPGTADYAHCMVAVHQSLGQPAVEVFRGLFPDSPGRADAAALSFERSFRADGNVQEYDSPVWDETRPVRPS